MPSPPMQPLVIRQPEQEPPPVYGPGQPPPAAVTIAKRPKDFVVYHDTSIPLWSQWDVPTALAALDQHTVGQFYQSSLLADAMGSDDAFDAVVQTRVLGLISRPFELKPSTRGNKTKARIACREIKERWDEIFPEDVLANLMRTYLLMGFAPAQMIWRYSRKRMIPAIQPWHSSTIYYDIPTRTYVANTMEGPVWIRPGDGKWLLMTPFGSYRGWMQGAVRAVVIPYLCRQYALRDWARYNEVHGLPIKKAMVPALSNETDKQNFTQAIANLGNETTVMLPQGVDKDGKEWGFDLQLLEATADTYEAFLDLISKCEERMAIRLLGQNLTTQVDAGSLAAANVHDRVRLDYTRFDAKAFGALRDQVLRAYCQYNFGDPDLAPEPCWNVTPPEDKLQKQQGLAQLAAAFVDFGAVKAPIDMRKMLERADIPLVEKTDDAPETPLLAPAPAAGGSGAPGAPKVTKPPAAPKPEKSNARSALRILSDATNVRLGGRRKRRALNAMSELRSLLKETG